MDMTTLSVMIAVALREQQPNVMVRSMWQHGYADGLRIAIETVANVLTKDITDPIYKQQAWEHFVKLASGPTG